MCQENFDCQNQFACANGMCTQYASIDDYEPSDNILACKSGFISNPQRSPVCLPTPKIVSNQVGPDYRCSTIEDSCVYETVLETGETHQVTHLCKCGLTSDGSSFCPYVYKDEYTKSF